MGGGQTRDCLLLEEGTKRVFSLQKVETMEWTRKGAESRMREALQEESLVYSGDWTLHQLEPRSERETRYWARGNQIMESLAFHAEHFGLVCSHCGAMKEFQVK